MVTLSHLNNALNDCGAGRTPAAVAFMFVWAHDAAHGALFVYLHHTHPDVPYFDHKPEWSNTIGQVYCSIVWRCSRLSEWLIHNIMIHVPHHVDSRIPFYRLKRAHAELQQAYGEYMHEYRFRWATVLAVFRQCKLYDYERKTWYSFREAAER